MDINITLIVKQIIVIKVMKFTLIQGIPKVFGTFQLYSYWNVPKTFGILCFGIHFWNTLYI